MTRDARQLLSAQDAQALEALRRAGVLFDLMRLEIVGVEKMLQRREREQERTSCIQNERRQRSRAA